MVLVSLVLMPGTTDTPFGDGAKRVAPVEAMICAVCGRVLDAAAEVDSSRPDGSGDRIVGWMHGFVDQLGPDGTGEDHPAVPVRPGEVPVRGRCDFCNADDPIVALSVEAFVMPRHGMPGGPEHASAEDWAACKDCAVLLAGERWNDLIRRVRSEQRRRGIVNPPEVFVQLAELYRQIALHTTGPLKPL